MNLVILHTICSQFSALNEFIKSTSFDNLTIGNIIMIISGLILIYLAIAKECEPIILLPLSFGIIIGNVPYISGYGLAPDEPGSFLNWVSFGITHAIYPSLILL